MVENKMTDNIIMRKESDEASQLLVELFKKQNVFLELGDDGMDWLSKKDNMKIELGRFVIWVNKCFERGYEPYYSEDINMAIGATMGEKERKADEKYLSTDNVSRVGLTNLVQELIKNKKTLLKLNEKGKGWFVNEPGEVLQLFVKIVKKSIKKEKELG